FWHLASPAAAVPPPVKKSPAQTICEIAFREAQSRSLPESYFIRLIWKESRFDPHAVSPKGAQGIAQFMPETAKLRGLDNPFTPVEALQASAHLLSDLKAIFGNLGLAAAAYNAGKDRVQAWLDGRRNLPAETLDYVLSITGRPASDWSRLDARYAIPPIGQGNSLIDCVNFASRPGNRALPVVKDQGSWKPWGSQLAGAPSEAVALAMFNRIQARHADLLGGLTPLVIRKRNLGMGLKPIANVRIGASSRAEAERFCAKLLKKQIACAVMRN
ncbi:MAG: lytic transglycosylase domain-containing protein, partial [Aestuariivirgaceae bacterium]